MKRIRLIIGIIVLIGLMGSIGAAAEKSLEQRVVQLEEKVAAPERLPGDLREVGRLIAEAVKYQAEKTDKLATEFEGIKRIESQQIKALDRIEVLASQIRTQGWISVVGVVVIIALIVTLLLLLRYHIAKLKEIEKKES